jgi:hypothetical protein
MVHSGDGSIGTADLAASKSKTFKRLWGGDLVDQLEVDVKEGRLAFGLGDDVLLPDFFEECFGVSTH